MHPYHDKLPVDLITQLVEHCTGVAEFKFQILLRYEFLSLQLEPLQIFCTYVIRAKTAMDIILASLSLLSAYYEVTLPPTKTTHKQNMDKTGAPTTVTQGEGC